MPIVYPLTLPATPGFVTTKWIPMTVVGLAGSPFTLQAQTQVWPGQGWIFQGTLPPMTVAQVDDWLALKLALNGVQGTVSLGDKTRPNTRGTAAGAWTVGAGAVALSTTLPIAGGAGAFAKGDWLQVSTFLHKVTQVNAGSVDVWPRLRGAYANGTAIVYASALGKFRLEDNETMDWSINALKHYGLDFRAVEAL